MGMKLFSIIWGGGYEMFKSKFYGIQNFSLKKFWMKSSTKV